MTRAVLYARFSSDMQSQSSIDDQMRVTEERALREGWVIVDRYADYGISGASMMRPGIQKLMHDGASGKFDIVVAEAMDRISRDQEDIAGIYKRLHFSGIKIFTLSEGEINEMHIGLKGTMNALFLKDLAAKTKRGMRGRVEHGFVPCGLSYGYSMLRNLDAKGELIRGERTIDENQAKIVQRIFEDYATGKSPETIAKELNKEGVAGPAANGWTQSTINGNRKRGNGLLNNELYIGRMVWNRQRFIKDPDTGKRVSRPNDPSEWIIKEVPEMRIIEQEVWDKVKERQRLLETKKTLSSKQRPRLLLSGLLQCGCCGGGFTKISKAHYGCFSAREKGTCDNMQNLRQDYIEAAVLGALESHLLDPRATDLFCNEYAKCLTLMHSQHNAALADYRAELKKCQKEDAKMVQAICDGFASPQLKDKMAKNTARLGELERLLEDKKEVPALLEPSMARHYRMEVKNLIASLNIPDARSEAADMIRTLVEKIVLTPKQVGAGLDMDMHGSLAGILTIAAGDKNKQQKRDIIQQVIAVAEGCDSAYEEVQEKLVAGAGFEPTTFRL